MNTILILESSPAVAEDLQALLAPGGYEIVVRATTESAAALLKEQKINAILISSEEEDMLSFVEELKQEASTKWIPAIFLSTNNHDSYRIDCFNHGADDFLEKPVNPKELITRVQRWISRIGGMEEMAFRDPLTKAYNRRYFDHQILIELQRAQRLAYPISLAFVDADKFKSVNDTYGHHVGDLVLKGLSKYLQEQTRSSDLVARYGGEEFVILLPNANAEQAANKMQAILEYVRTHEVAVHSGMKHFVTFSCGVAEWKPGMSAEEWTQIADDGVYEAKEQGRNRIVLSAVRQDAEADTPRKPRLMFIGNRDAAKDMNTDLEVLNYEQFADVLDRDEEVDLCILTSTREAPLDGNALSLFRETKLPEHCKLLLISEKKAEEDMFQSMMLGIDGFIRMPYDTADLELQIKRMV
ncbi:diguanylate cyclase (GGDEF)-like protein [Paenibacillus mucilaginosus]|uniref:GGDEF domain-containing response regulator n=1 Tax=Paenibacillus mucilaginosus TaxID=61624 RepID=UPI003D1F94E8